MISTDYINKVIQDNNPLERKKRLALEVVSNSIKESLGVKPKWVNLNPYTFIECRGMHILDAGHLSRLRDPDKEEGFILDGLVVYGDRDSQWFKATLKMSFFEDGCIGDNFKKLGVEISARLKEMQRSPGEKK